MKQKGTLYTGTSNVTLPGNKLSFPEEFQQKTRLAYYASLFNSLEINSSFYKIPMQRTYARWASEVPENFKFTIKLFKGITHNKGLQYNQEDLVRFMDAAEGLEGKKGNILVQFPKSITGDRFDEVQQIIAGIRTCDPAGSWGIAVELRHESWFGKGFYGRAINDFLDGEGATLVIHDMPGCTLTQPNKKASSVFLRFHGEGGNYRGSYPHDSLTGKAGQILQWLEKGRDVYAYFNNTIGDAYNNARTLDALVNSK